MCLAGIVVACWCQTQEVTGSSPFTVMTDIFVTDSLNSVKTFRKNSNETELQFNLELIATTSYSQHSHLL